MKVRAQLLVSFLGLHACAPDYLDLGYDHAAVGTGGSGGGSLVCTPGETRECYTGPEGTNGQGICKAGQETCNVDGSGFGACEGEQLPSPEDCATPEDDDCDGLSPSCGGEILWARHFGATLDQAATAVGCEANGDVAITGYFSSVVDFGGGALTAAGAASPINADVFVAKYDQGGAHLWSRRFGDGAPQKGRSLAVDNDSLAVVGEMYATTDFGGGALSSSGGTDIFVTKLDAASGAHLWSKSFGSSGDDVAYGVAVDSTGNVVLVGALAGPVDFGGGAVSHAGGTDIFVTKLDAASGAHLWSKSFGSAGDDVAYGVAVDSTGNVVLVGALAGPVDFGGGAVSHAGGTDIFVTKLDAGSGTHLWSKSFGSSGDDVAYGVAVDTSGNVVLAGALAGPVDFGGGIVSHAGGTDIFVTKLDAASGAHLWSKSFGSSGDDVAHGVAVDSTGKTVVVGAFEQTITFGGKSLKSSGGTDAVVAKLDSNGGHLWSQRRGDSQTQQATANCLTTAGESLVTLDFRGSVDVETENISSDGDGDALLLKLAP